MQISCLLALTAATVMPLGTLASGGFTATCQPGPNHNPAASMLQLNFVLEPLCRSMNGQYLASWIHLSRCLYVNENMQFQWNDGDASRGNHGVCGNCVTSPDNQGHTILSCDCAPFGSSDQTRLSINLDEQIWNYDGIVGCYDRAADVGPYPIDPPSPINP